MARSLTALAGHLGDRLRGIGYDEATIRARLGTPSARTTGTAAAIDPQLLATTFTLAEAHELVQRLAYADGRYRADGAVLRLQRSAGVEGRVPADPLEALFLTDGVRPLGTVLDELAEDRGISAAGLRTRAASVFLDLYQRGFLTR